jgi:hypothetical protein
VWIGEDSYRAIQTGDPETDKAQDYTGAVVHERCWDEWARCHDAE